MMRTTRATCSGGEATARPTRSGRRRPKVSTRRTTMMLRSRSMMMMMMLEGAQHCFATADDDEAYGDFENLDESDDDSSDGEDEAAPAADEDKPLEGREAIAAAKARAMAQKAEEDEEDDDDFAADARQALRDRAAKTDRVFADDEERLALEGHRAGLYVRVRLEDVPVLLRGKQIPQGPSS